MILYDIKNLTKTYGEKENIVEALKGVSLTIEDNKFIVVLGASGSGKSTLLNILGGMDNGTEGSVIFKGTDISKFKAQMLTNFRAEHVGFVFQSYNLLPNLTALENVEFSTEIRNLAKSGAMDALRLVGLADRADHFPAELSGGEQQRVSIARAIAKSPEVLLCDEPTGALDYKTGVKILKVLKDINAEKGTSIIFITHNQEIAKAADIVINMRSGEIVKMTENSATVQAEQLEW